MIPLVLSQQAQARQYEKQASLHQSRIAYLEEQLRLLLHKRFGTSSERNADQLGLFNEAGRLLKQPNRAKRTSKSAPIPAAAASAPHCRMCCPVWK